jgi:hypothetical protein
MIDVNCGMKVVCSLQWTEIGNEIVIISPTHAQFTSLLRTLAYMFRPLRAIIRASQITKDCRLKCVSMNKILELTVNRGTHTAQREPRATGLNLIKRSTTNKTTHNNTTYTSSNKVLTTFFKIF